MKISSMVGAVAALVFAAGGTAQTQTSRDFQPIVFGDPEQLAYDAPFFAGAHYDTSVPPPEVVLEQIHGSRLSHHAEIVECFRRWALSSERVQVSESGRTYEGRALLRVIISSPENLARLDEIRAGVGRLADPRGVAEGELQRLLDESPAVAFLGYSIHGDELSGADAAVALGYHLAASTDAEVVALLQDVVVVMDPCMNPDGRERIISMVEQSAGYVPNLDYRSMQRGRWPWGRGNHYLFDLNRDWMTGVHPETRARWEVMRDLPPQLFVDAHEMGHLDNFLFYPQSPPYNPYLPETLDGWHKTFAAGAAAAFDRQGWAYYTREWADGWGPFYSDAWGSLGGAVGILYEQASTSGFPLIGASGQVHTYRESVHHQATASLANLKTLSARRRDVLADYLAHKQSNVAAETPGNERVFVLLPGRHPSRERALVSLLVEQGVEVWRTRVHDTLLDALDTRGASHETLDLPPGSYVVPARQPQRPRVRAYLEFDPRMTEAFLLDERKELETKGRSRIYDTTAWSLPLLFDVEAYWADGLSDNSRIGAAQIVTAEEVGAGATGLVGGDAATVAWIVDGADDRAPAFAAQAMARGLAVHLADKPFQTGGRAYARGSLIVRRADNAGEIATRVDHAAQAADCAVYATSSGRSPDDGPDLGGGHFTLLEKPRVGVLSNAPVSPDTFGHLWFLLDHEVGLTVSHLDAQTLGWQDLRRYNVLVLPPGSGGEQLLSSLAERLKTWVSAGGTLIACGNAATALATEHLGISSVVRRRDKLEHLDGYTVAARREREARNIEVDMEALWGDAPAADPATTSGESTPKGEAGSGSEQLAAAEPASGAEAENGKKDGKKDDESSSAHAADPDAVRQDAWMRRFSPAGVILRGLVDTESWLTAGCDEQLPVLVSGSTALLAREPVQTAVRLAPADDLRLAGLLWPEARERLAESAWLTRERCGRGQVILFAAMPGYRGHFRSGARLFANAVVYGPGAGASPPVGW